jgi:hypothetical protein
MPSTSEKRSEAGRKGGEAPHEKRGLQAASKSTREKVAHEGGEARGKEEERGKKTS